MRIYFPLNQHQVETLFTGSALSFADEIAVAPTQEFAKLLETTDEDELTLIAALTAADLVQVPCVIAVAEMEAEIVDAEIGEVRFSADVKLADLDCWLLPDLPTDDVSWFGLQETQTVLALLNQLA